LGLAIARGFTEANGGTLHVESLPEQGATFVFELPLDPVVSAEGTQAPIGIADEGHGEL
jgi:two-component system sensor histidine kinase KdpD